MTDPDVTGRISAEQVHAQRLASLESSCAAHAEHITTLDRHRERMETRWSIVTAAVGALALGGLALAGVTRDTTRDNTARISVVERTQTDAAGDSRASAVEARSTHDAIVRLTATVEGLRAQVDTLASELRSRDAERSGPRR